ncbi:arginine--tRNA ligase [Candidatus Peregrinibacteria bacterium]|nr:arginine--tRNA ligase [Candidatus Peregrinibacteria bacterium]
MKIRLNNEVCSHLPGLNVAVLVFNQLKNDKKSSSLDQLLRGVCAQKRAQLKNDASAKELNQKINASKKDSQVLPEVQLLESTLRKIQGGKDLSADNNIYTILHYLSLRNLVPFYAVDLDETEKDLEINFIEAKPGLKAKDVNFTKETTNIAVWILDIGTKPKDEFDRLADLFAKDIQKYCNGLLSKAFYLNADFKEADLDYESEKEREYKATHEAEMQQQQAEETENKNVEQPPFMTEPRKEIIKVKTIRDEIIEGYYDAIHAWLKERNPVVDISKDDLQLENPADPEHGDFSLNIALKLSKQMQDSPQQIANDLVNALPKLNAIEKIEVAGPGFINLFLTPEYFEQNLNKILEQKSNYGRSDMGQNQDVIIEFSSPNIAKPLAVHHLLSTIIGQTLVNLYKYTGYNVIALNYPGDWGTQFGKLLYAYKHWGNEEVVKKDPLNELLKLYVEFHNKAETDPSLEDHGREEFRKLEEGDEENTRLWKWFREISIANLENIYQKLDVRFDEYLGEQMYIEKAKELIESGINREIIVDGESGSKIIRFENDKYPPYILQKGDGTTIYATRDLASIKDRIERWNPHKILYVVDVAQSLHFNQLFEAAKRFGFDQSELVHVVFGRMQMPEGRMSTRKGEVILLDEVIDEALLRTERIVDEKSRDLSTEEKHHVARDMAIGAVKYNILSQNRETNITFDWDRMLSLDGNSGPYLQYAYARAASILRKSKEQSSETSQPEKPANEAQSDLFTSSTLNEHVNAANEKPFAHNIEHKLMKKLTAFPEKVEAAVKENKPNLLTNYLFELAKDFNSFYNEVHVLSALNDDVKTARLKLVEATKHVLQNGLNILGIKTIEKI